MTGLISKFERSRVIAWRKGVALTQGQFLADIVRLSERLPGAQHAFNLCDDRYNFLVTLGAAITRGQISLLPNSAAPGDLAKIAARYPDVYLVYDGRDAPISIQAVHVSCTGDESIAGRVSLPTIMPDKMVVYAFTSGSTGIPVAAAKSWRALVAGATELEHIVGPTWTGQYSVVATVPSGHSYGLETTVLPPLQSGCSIACDRPLFPADVEAALGRVPRPRCLVTTPVHLTSLISSSVAFPPIDMLMCATAPLPIEVARRAETRFSARILEIYGCTESGYVATRWTTDGGDWVIRSDMRIRQLGDSHSVVADFLPDPVALADLIEMTDDCGFRLLGRSSDMINIAGKRASLSGMNHILREIEGVEDGVVFIPDEDSSTAVSRLVAIAVAPKLSEDAIRAAIRRRVDPVFVPRQVILVDVLPRNETGKLPIERLRAFLSRRSVKR